MLPDVSFENYDKHVPFIEMPIAKTEKITIGRVLHFHVVLYTSLLGIIIFGRAIPNDLLFVFSVIACALVYGILSKSIELRWFSIVILLSIFVIIPSFVMPHVWNLLKGETSQNLSIDQVKDLPDVGIYHFEHAIVAESFRGSYQNKGSRLVRRKEKSWDHHYAVAPLVSPEWSKETPVGIWAVCHGNFASIDGRNQFEGCISNWNVPNLAATHPDPIVDKQGILLAIEKAKQLHQLQEEKNAMTLYWVDKPKQHHQSKIAAGLMMIFLFEICIFIEWIMPKKNRRTKR